MLFRACTSISMKNGVNMQIKYPGTVFRNWKNVPTFGM